MDGGLQSSRGLTRRTNKFAGTKQGDAGGGYMKNIVIFADGTGQIGGLRPDQRLSHVYKMYRAMRPGPSSPISYRDQVTYYDPGLGAGEIDGVTPSQIKSVLNRKRTRQNSSHSCAARM